MTGSNYGWGETWKQLTPVYGAEGEYWSIVYLESGEKINYSVNFVDLDIKKPTLQKIL